MSSESDKKTVNRIPLEVFNEGKLEVVDEVLAPEFTEHGQTMPGSPSGREGIKAIAQQLRSTFPDFHYEVLHTICEGDMCVQHMRASGTMKGDFMGMKATGKHGTWEEAHIVRLKDGKAVEHWPLIDQLGVFQQLGLMSMPSDAMAA
jgi:predicted ester cyclase